jgi:hypothetical protein
VPDLNPNPSPPWEAEEGEPGAIDWGRVTSLGDNEQVTGHKVIAVIPHDSKTAGLLEGAGRDVFLRTHRNKKTERYYHDAEEPYDMIKVWEQADDYQVAFSDVRTCKYAEEVMACKHWNEWDLAKRKMRELLENCDWDEDGKKLQKRRAPVWNASKAKMEQKIVYSIRPPGLPGKLAFETAWNDFRQILKSIRDTDEAVLPSRFWSVVYNDPILTEHRLARIMHNDRNYDFFAGKLHANASDGLDQTRLWYTNRYMSESPAQCYWWVFWQDFWQNNHDMTIFKDEARLNNESNARLNKYLTGFVQDKIYP